MKNIGTVKKTSTGVRTRLFDIAGATSVLIFLTVPILLIFTIPFNQLFFVIQHCVSVIAICFSFLVTNVYISC